MNIEKRTIAWKGLTLRSADDSGTSTVEGVAVPFGDIIDTWDGAETFDRDCSFEGLDEAKLCFEHGETIGRITKAESTDDGLHITARISDTARGRDAMTLIRDGVLDSFSVGFIPLESQKDRDGITHRRKVSQLLTHDTLPATGMSMEYHVVTSDTTAVGKQETEGSELSFGKVAFGTKTADINTYGGYTSLSRQTIERSTTPMLNTAITALQNAYAKATEKAVRDHLYAEIKAQRDASSNANKIDAPQLANMTIDDWVSLIIDASELADDRNVSLTRLAVSKDVLKALVKLKDTGDRFFNLSGDRSDTIGSFDLTGVAGTFMRIPVVLLPNADAGLASFIDPAAVTVWESGGPAQLTDGNVTGLTNSYSVYGYMAVATTHADGLIPVKFATA